ncbi:hypothetical protein TIFTF001_029607 [Ficus carica]|uniref:Uncharacterized protein n=1 Tax=Ficus carica TaxID=3494 RepID=A0AA88J322_FICCA|nr:hypothetical protein TIFTF001_029607 [Ficus carica]
MTKVLSDSSKTTYFTELLAVDDHDPEERENYEVVKHLLTMATHDFAVINCIPGVEDFDPLSGEVCRYYLRLVSHCDRIICLCARYPSACECIWLLNPALKESRVVLCDRLYGGFNVGAVGFAAELYTLSTNSRKEIELGVEISLFSSSEYQTLYCNGICYWYYWNCRCTKIIAFDVGDEVFHSIRPPPDNVKSSIKRWKNLADRSKIVVWSNSIASFFYGKGGPAVIDMGIMGVRL